MEELVVGPVEELPPGEMKIVRDGQLEIGVYNCDGELLRDRGPLLARRRAALRGRLRGGASAPSSARGTAPASTCARAGLLTLPAYLPVDTFEVRVEDGLVKVVVP